jgi:hypothetical protein
MKHFPIKETPINATVIEEQRATPKNHYFYAYQYSLSGAWFSSMLYPTAQEALNSMTDPTIMHKKLCCIVL